MKKELNQISEQFNAITENVKKVIIGKDEQIRLLEVAFLCRGHVLIDDVPGLGKTMLARAFARSIGGQFKRIQCTPDLLPSDIIGVSIYNPEKRQFMFRKGPVFCQVLLVDEINRATPRTQSAFLEAMGENQVTIEGLTSALPDPFMTIATQNPVEFEGTFPLPEAQMDRFFLSLSLGYPTMQEESVIIEGQQYKHPIENIEPVVEISQISADRDHLGDVYVEKDLRHYMLSIIERTRKHERLLLGASPRASLALFKASQALAILNGRDYVIPDDIKYLAPYILTHRLIVKAESKIKGYNAEKLVYEIVHGQEVPLEEE